MLYTFRMLDTLITSKTRIKLLLKFFLNPDTKGYLRGLEQEFKEGSNSIRLELNRFEEAGLLQTSSQGNKKFFQANTSHPMFGELNSLIKKYIGVDKIIEWMAVKSGDVEAVYLSGKLAQGLNSSLIDMIIVGDDLNKDFIQMMIKKGEKLIDRKVRWVQYSIEEFEREQAEFDQVLLIWKTGKLSQFKQLVKSDLL